MNNHTSGGSIAAENEARDFGKRRAANVYRIFTRISMHFCKDINVQHERHVAVAHGVLDESVRDLEHCFACRAL